MNNLIKAEYKWNRVYSFVMDLKALYLKANPETEHVYEKLGFESVLHRWAAVVESIAPEYAQILRFVQVNQYGNLCLLKYKPYTSIFSEVDYETFWELNNQFYRYCRGVTVDIKSNNLVLCAYDKFFNIDELPETATDKVVKRIESASVIEITDKMDGSLQMARAYNGEIILSGSTAIDPEESFRVQNGLKFIHSHENYLKMLEENPDICFIFESIMPDDPHVVVYNYDYMKGLWLTGARNLNTGEVFNYEKLQNIINKYKPYATAFEPISFDEMLDARKDFKCDEKEGWVVNIDGWRVKVKCDDFLTFHGLLSGLRKNSDRLGSSLLDAMKMDRVDDFISTLPGRYHEEALETLATIQKYVNYFEENVKKYYESGMDVTVDPKEFMTWVSKNVPAKFQGGVRNMYRGKTTDYLRGKKFRDIVEVINNAQ